MSVRHSILILLLGLPLATSAAAASGDTQCLSGKKILMTAKKSKGSVAVLSKDSARRLSPI